MTLFYENTTQASGHVNFAAIFTWSKMREHLCAHTYPGDGVGEERLAAAGRTVQQEAARGRHAQLPVHLRVLHMHQQLTQLLQHNK